MEAKNVKPDFPDIDGDGDTKEPISQSASDAENNEEMEEGNEFSGARQDAIDAGEDEFEVDGKTYPVKESLQLSEEEMIDLIEKIVNEQKIEGIKTQDSAMKKKILIHI
jgi:enolase